MKRSWRIGEFRGIGVYMHATFLILVGRDLPSAMRLHKQVMVSHPSNPEGEYSRAQIQNIVDAVVPNGKLLDAQLELARTHFEHEHLMPGGFLARHSSRGCPKVATQDE